MPKGIPNKKYTGEYKQKLVEEIRINKKSYHEVSREYEVVRSVIRAWERIYLEEGAEGLYVERRGRSSPQAEQKKDVHQSLKKRLKKI